MGRLLLLLLALGYNLLAQAGAPALVYTEESGDVIELTPWVSEFQASELIDYRELPPQNDPRWQQLPKQGTHGMGAQNRWLRIDIDVRTHPGSRVLSINNPLLDNLRLYHLVNGNLMAEHHFGDSLPFDERLLLSTQFLYPLQLRPWEHHTLLLRVDTEGSSHVPLTLMTPGHLSQMLESRNLVQGFQLGILTAIGLFSLFVALASGSFSYSYYAAYVLSMTLLVASLQGVAFRYLWPQLPAMQAWVIPFLLPLVMCFALMFAEKVLQLKYLNIRMLRICRFSATFSLFLALLSPFISYSLAMYCDLVALLGIAVVLLAFALVQAMRGQKLARLYFVGWIVFLASVIVTSLIYLGAIQTTMEPLSPAMAGVTFEIVFMSLVLAIRYSDERKAKQRIQQEALEQAKRIREAREEALKVEAESNERLEEMVQERTLELEIALRELNEVNQKLTEQTTIDSLIGVKNRAAFNKRLQAEGRISRRQQTPMALLMLDVDHFKNINDKYGHLAGDYTLKAIADTLSALLRRPTDLVSRFGGEEFAIILPSTDAEGALAVAEHIREAVEELTIEWEQFKIPLTVSIGVSSNIIESDEHPLQLLEQADKALYQAKHDGRNRVGLFQDIPVPHP